MLFVLAASVSPVPESGPVPAGTSGGVAPAVVAADTAASAAIGSIVTGCVVPAWVLLAVGKIESNNAAGRSISPDGEVAPPIIGPALDGAIPGTAAIPATDGGALTGDPVWSHAVGPMQILPSTWQRWARSASGAGPPDPENVDDAALTAAVILCQPPGDLSDPAQLARALLSYNHSSSYVSEVLSWARYFAAGNPGVSSTAGVSPTPGEVAPSITPVTQPASS